MARQRKMKAQLRYHKRDDGREGYNINFYSESDGEWLTDTWFPLVSKNDGEGEPDYVHWSLLRKLAEMQAMGYDIDLMF